MAKRRLSQQQKKRIQQTQDAQTDNAAHQSAQVISHQGGQLLVELESGYIECKIKSNLGSIVCGDFVTIETTAQNEHRAIAISPRENLLQRLDAHGQVRTIASNISQLLVCLAVSPEPNLFLLDQYLLSAEQQKIEACILLNKLDLCSDVEDPFQLRKVYQPLGYQVVHTSVESGQGMDQLKQISELSFVTVRLVFDLCFGRFLLDNSTSGKQTVGLMFDLHERRSFDLQRI